MKKQGEMMVELLREVTARKPSETSTPGTLTARDITDKCYSMLAGQYEEKYGGFGTQPKFPHPGQRARIIMKLTFLARGLYKPCRPKSSFQF